jgi:hypothetical protein
VIFSDFFPCCFLNTCAITSCSFKKLKLSHYTPWRRLGERNYSSYSFLTSELDGGEWSASCSCRTLDPGRGHPVPIGQEAGRAPEPVWTQRLEEKSFYLCQGSNPNHLVVQSAIRHYTVTLVVVWLVCLLLD